MSCLKKEALNTPPYNTDSGMDAIQAPSGVPLSPPEADTLSRWDPPSLDLTAFLFLFHVLSCLMNCINHSSNVLSLTAFYFCLLPHCCGRQTMCAF